MFASTSYLKERKKGDRGAKICKFLAKLFEYQKHIWNTHLPASLTLEVLQHKSIIKFSTTDDSPKKLLEFSVPCLNL